MWCTSRSGFKRDSQTAEYQREAARRIPGFRSSSQLMTPLLGILLALACALATNVGFLYKHRGACAAPAVDMKRPFWSAKSLFASKLFALGMLIAAGAWVFHVAAMTVAPLSLVQAVLAGGVVLLAIMAEKMFGLKIGRRQWLGLGLTAFGLMLLGVSRRPPAVPTRTSRCPG